MILTITVHSNSKRLTINIPQIRFSEDLPNIIALDFENKICAVGETEDERRLIEGFEEWKSKRKIRFINPFEFDKYDVSYVVNILNFYVIKALIKIGRGLFLGRLLYRCDYDLWLWNYDNLSSDLKYEFEYSLRKKHFIKIRNLSINGRLIEAPSTSFLKKKKKQINQQRVADWTLKFFTSLWLIILWIPLLIVSATLDPVINYDWIFWVVLLVIFTITGLLTYLSLCLGAVSWMYIMRHYLSASLMKDFLPSLGVSKQLIKWFADELLGEGKVNSSES